MEFEFDAEESHVAFIRLCGAGISADLVSQGGGTDLIRVPPEEARRARMILGW